MAIILESKVVQKLNLEKNVYIIKWSPRLMFWNDFSENYTQKYSHGTQLKYTKNIEPTNSTPPNLFLKVPKVSKGKQIHE